MAYEEAVAEKEALASNDSLWRNHNFLLLWIGQSAGELGPQIATIAIPLIAAKTLNASAFEVSLITFLGWFPYLVFSLPAGVIADRLDQRKLMIFCDFGRMALILSVPLVATLGHLTLGYLYVVVACIGVLTVLFNVAYRSQLPRLIRRSQLVDANGKLGVSMSLAELVGPALAGALAGLVGLTKTLFANALTLLASATTLWLISLPKSADPDPDPAVPAPTSVLKEMVAGLVFVRRDSILWKVLLCTTTSNFFVMASTSIEVVFLVRVLDASSLVVGLVYTASAVGGLVAGALALKICEIVGTARIIWVSMLAPGPLYLLMPFAMPGWGVLLFSIGLAVFSVNATLFNVAGTSYRQAVCPPELLSRVNAAFLWICYGAIPLGALFGGLVGSWFGLRTGILVCVLGMWSASLFVVFSPLRRMRDVPALDTIE